MATGARAATRVRTARRDRLDPTPAPPAERIYLTGLAILPRQALEEGKGWTTLEGHDIYVLPTSRVQAVVGGVKRKYQDGDIVSSDQLEIDGELWQVDGPPAAFDKGRARKATLIRVKRVGSAS